MLNDTRIRQLRLKLPILSGLLLATAAASSQDDVGLTRPAAFRSSLSYTGELFGASGENEGLRTEFFGLAHAAVDVGFPTHDAVGSQAVHLSALWLHGDPVSDTLGDVNGVSNIGGVSTLRLYHAWYQQSSGERRVRIGKFDVDEDFMVSEPASLFTNSGFGAMATATANMPLPTYPLAGAGALLAVRSAAGIGFSGAVFDGDVGSEADRRDGLGLGSSGVGGVLVAAELRWDHELAMGGGTFKLGGMVHTGEFETLQGPADHRGNGFVYAVLDQKLWRCDRPALIGFLRASAAPFDDRNLVTYQLDAGVVLYDPFSRDADDGLGIAVLNTWWSDDARRDPQFAGRISETVLEITLLARVFPRFTVQPVLQCVWGSELATGDHALVPGLRLSMDL